MMSPSGQPGLVPLAAACGVVVFLGRLAHPDERRRDGCTKGAPLPVDKRVMLAAGVAGEQRGDVFIAFGDFAPFEGVELWVVPAYLALVCHETKPRLLESGRWLIRRQGVIVTEESRRRICHRVCL